MKKNIAKYIGQQLDDAFRAMRAGRTYEMNRHLVLAAEAVQALQRWV